MGRTARADEPVVISTTLYDGDETKYVRAYIYEDSGDFVSSIDLLHRAFGFYHQTFVPPSEGQYSIVTIVYDLPDYTSECLDYERRGEVLFVSRHTEANPLEMAEAVWDETLPGRHDLTNSSGAFLQSIKETVIQTLNEIKVDPNHSLSILEQKIIGNRTILTSEINENEAKIDQMLSDANSNYLQIRTDISGVSSLINSSSADMLSFKNELKADINVNTNKLDVVLAQLSQLQNQTRFIAIVPPNMTTPDSGTKPYRFYLSIYDQNGAPEAPDMDPSVTITDSNGTVLVDDVSLTQDGTKIGQYFYIYDLSASTPETILGVTFKVTENSVISYVPRSSEITAYDSDMAQILNRVNYFGAVTEQNQSLLTGVDGLSILHTEILTNRNEVLAIPPVLATIKAKTDLIISDPVTQTDMSYMSNKIDSLPTNAFITSTITNQTDSIKGLDSRNLTEIYDNEQGTSNALLANDPRLAFLDAAISSRSDMTTAEVWNYGVRELTDAPPLTSNDVALVWDFLVNNVAVNGSIGKLLVDTLDEANSARGLTISQAQTLVAPLALEATSNLILNRVSDENNENEAILNYIRGVVDLIKPQTDKIVSDGARESTLNNNFNDLNAILVGLDLLAQDVKAKTDNLPNDPASESSLSSIPTNPLLTNDARLNLLPNLIMLDEYVSSRTAIADLPTNYALEASLTASRQESSDYRDEVMVALSAKPDAAFFATTQASVEHTKTQLDLAMEGFIAGDDLHSIRNWQLSQAGAQLTAQQIWEYGSRELTQSFDYTTQADLDAQTDTLTQQTSDYFCRMTTTFNSNLDQQAVLCWLDVNGVMQENAVSASVIVHDESGNEIWAQNSTDIIMPGVIKFIQGNISSLIGSVARNYLMKVIINTDSGAQFSSVQPFFTV